MALGSDAATLRLLPLVVIFTRTPFWPDRSHCSQHVAILKSLLEGKWASLPCVLAMQVRVQRFAATSHRRAVGKGKDFTYHEGGGHTRS